MLTLAALPGFIDAVKVDDFTIGKNALRIISMRALPDQPGEKDYPKEEWIDQGDPEAALDPNRRKKIENDKEKQLKTEGQTPEDEDQTGDYVNFEVSAWPRDGPANDADYPSWICRFHLATSRLQGSSTSTMRTCEPRNLLPLRLRRLILTPSTLTLSSQLLDHQLFPRHA